MRKGAHGPPAGVLAVVVLAQFACTSLWFGGNAFSTELAREFAWPASATATLSMAVQAGFIMGTLLFAVLALPDRLRPVRLFSGCAFAAAGLNALIPLTASHYRTVVLLRAATGFGLAGIYPVGMKIVASWSPKGLGAALGWLVGALVLGTALPHAMRASGVAPDWRAAYGAVSVLAVGGGLLVLGMTDGPMHRGAAVGGAGTLARIAGSRAFRTVALGYFGHMWELYAFWVFVPLLSPSPMATAVIVAAGAPACVLGGWLSSCWGSARVAALALGISGTCCVAAPFMPLMGQGWRLGLLVLWGAAVVMDSPQLSALTAAFAPAEHVGTALTIVTSIGFGLTLLSIDLLGNVLRAGWEPGWAFLLLAPGPFLGLWALRSLPVAPESGS